METALTGGEPGTNSTYFLEAIRKHFNPKPIGRTFVPQYDEEGFMVTPEGMTPRQAQDAKHAYYEEQATPADTEKPNLKAVMARESLRGPNVMAGEGSEAKKSGGSTYLEPGMGFARHSELKGDDPVRVQVGTRDISDPAIKEDFATYLSGKYPKGSTEVQTVKAAAEFLRGDQDTGTVQPVSKKLLAEFLKQVQPKRKYTSKTLRRVDELDL